MWNIFTVPDKEKNFQSYMVFSLAILWQVFVAAVVSMGFLFFPNLWPRWLGFVCISLFIALFNLVLNHKGYTRLASWTFTIMLWLQITLPCYSAGGMLAPGIISQMSVILTAGFLLGWRGGVFIGLLTVGNDLAMAVMEMNGHLPTPKVIHTPITRWIGAIIPFGTIIALQYYATNHLRRGMIALKREVIKRERAEKDLIGTVYNLEERVKELKTLYAVGHILQVEETSTKSLVEQIAETIRQSWPFADSTAARVSIANTEYATSNYKPSTYSQLAETTTKNGTRLSIEVVYLDQAPDGAESPFFSQERSLINTVLEKIKMNVEWRERGAEIKQYKYAMDLGTGVSIANVEGIQTFVNDNFCKISKYTADELIGSHYGIIASGYHSDEYFTDLAIAMKDGKPYRGEFCNKAKDGSLYWVDTTIVPFLDEEGKVFQYLSMNQDITERKEAEDKIKRSEKLLKKITSQVPGNTYMFEIDKEGCSIFHFISRGTDNYNHEYGFDELNDNPDILREVLHENDRDKFVNVMKEAYRTQGVISFQYRIVVRGTTRWRWMQAIPEKDINGKVIWYGATSDITPLVDYIASVEQIIFDISHVIRRPVSTMLGMSQLMVSNRYGEKEIQDISQKINLIAEEMDKFVKGLNEEYHQKRQEKTLNIDIASLIDKRSYFFS
jgi:PAS domain S-box-containing protein